MGTMFLDHAAVALIVGSGLRDASPFFEAIGLAMRLIGRMAFPLFAFLLVQGILYTKCWRKYALRLAVFAVVSEVPFDLVASGRVWDPAAQNTLVTLLIGVVCLRGIMALETWTSGAECRSEGSPGSLGGTSGGRMPIGGSVEADGSLVRRRMFGAFGQCLIALLAMMVAELLRADYGAMGILLILELYFSRFQPQVRVVVGGMVLLAMYAPYFEYTLAASVAFCFINRYNGEKGKPLGYAAYAFYPVHLIGLYLAGLAIGA